MAGSRRMDGGIGETAAVSAFAIDVLPLVLVITLAVNQALDLRVHGLSARHIKPIFLPGDIYFPTYKPLLSFGPKIICPCAMPADMRVGEDIMNP